ncbi:MAG: hypothetical protein JO265_08045 [Acidimicrobiia bacterium]|nr:hypothetical protein [Acidimicrobiia bacterium]
MHTPRPLRPLSAVLAGAILLVAAACNGPLAHRAAPSQNPVVAPAPSVSGGAAPSAGAAVTPTTAPSGSAPTASAPVRTDDLDAGLQQADTQLSQTGSAVSTADQPPQPGD